MRYRLNHIAAFAASIVVACGTPIPPSLEPHPYRILPRPPIDPHFATLEGARGYFPQSDWVREVSKALSGSAIVHGMEISQLDRLCVELKTSALRDAIEHEKPETVELARAACLALDGSASSVDHFAAIMRAFPNIQAAALPALMRQLAERASQETIRWLADTQLVTPEGLDLLAQHYGELDKREDALRVLNEVDRIDAHPAPETACQRGVNRARLQGLTAAAESLESLAKLKAAATGGGLSCLTRVSAVRCQVWIEQQRALRTVPLWKASVGLCQGYLALNPEKASEVALTAAYQSWPEESHNSVTWLNEVVIAIDAFPRPEAIELALIALQNAVTAAKPGQLSSDVFERMAGALAPHLDRRQNNILSETRSRFALLVAR